MVGQEKEERAARDSSVIFWWNASLDNKRATKMLGGYQNVGSLVFDWRRGLVRARYVHLGEGSGNLITAIHHEP